MKDLDKIYTMEAAAEKVGVSKMTLYKALKEKKIKSRRLGSRWIITEKNIQDFLTGEEDE